MSLFFRNDIYKPQRWFADIVLWMLDGSIGGVSCSLRGGVVRDCDGMFWE